MLIASLRLREIARWFLAGILGRRSAADTNLFIDKLDKATEGKFQITTDGFGPYRDAIGFTPRRSNRFRAVSEDLCRATRRASLLPGESVRHKSRALNTGRPDRDRVCTSHVERNNLTIRMQMRRLTRLTNGFRKKWENLKAAYALHFAYYNFCRIHSSIRCRLMEVDERLPTK